MERDVRHAMEAAAPDHNVRATASSRALAGAFVLRRLT